LVDITTKLKGKGFQLFDSSDYAGGICAAGCSEYSRKQMDELTEWVKRPQIGAKGLIYIKIGTDGVIKSSLEKYLLPEELKSLASGFNAKTGDLIMIIPGETTATQGALGLLRVEMGNRLGLRPKDTFQPLWVVDFPLLEWNEETGRWSAMHHPFTSPKPEDIPMLDTDPGNVRANAYDLVINGVEIGGGSVRIFDSSLQALMFKVLGFTPEQAENQFGFLMNAFKYGAPPHAGIAFGFDRMVSMFAGLDSIRDVIAFPKNNSGRDVMNDSPSVISEEQLKELHLLLNLKV
jgi:aspartyl-tRNA synthetase